MNPCDVIILKDCRKRSYKRILVPFAGGPHSLLALKVAAVMVDKEEGEIIPFNVTVPGKPTADIEQFLLRYAAELPCPVEHGGCHWFIQHLRCPTKMRFQNLPNVHTARYAQRVEDNVNWRSIGQERHVLHR